VGHPQALGGLLIAEAAQVAQDDRGPKPLRQSAHLRVEQGDLLGRQAAWGAAPLGRGSPPLMPAAPGIALACAGGDVAGNAEQPRAQRVGPANRPGLAGQDHKRRLEGVLGVVGVAQHGAAGGPHEGPVAADDDLEGRGGAGAACGEEAQQLPVRPRRQWRGKAAAQVVKDDGRAGPHEAPR
jgi:hypothetical protein